MSRANQTTWIPSVILPRSHLVALYISLLGAAAAVLYVHDPATSGLYPPCPFRFATGLLCPGCGSLRGLHQLLHGNLASAFGLNPLMILSLPLLATAGLTRAWTRRRGLERGRARHRAWAWGALVVLLTYWILRNIF